MWIQSDTAYRGACRSSVIYIAQYDRWNSKLNQPTQMNIAMLPEPPQHLAKSKLDITWLVQPDIRVWYCYRERGDQRPIDDGGWILWDRAASHQKPLFVACNAVRRLTGHDEMERDFTLARARTEDKEVALLIGDGVKSGKWACTAMKEKINVPTDIRHIAQKRDCNQGYLFKCSTQGPPPRQHLLHSSSPERWPVQRGRQLQDHDARAQPQPQPLASPPTRRCRARLLLAHPVPPLIRLSSCIGVVVAARQARAHA